VVDGSQVAEAATQNDELAAHIPELEARTLILWVDDSGTADVSSYQVQDGEILVQEDLNLGAEADAWRQHSELLGELRSTGGLKSLSNERDRRIWGDRIRYSIGGYYRRPENADQLRVIAQAVDDWNRLRDVTGIEWVYDGGLDKRDSGVRFDHVASRKTCNAKVGRHNRRRDINLTETCGRNVGTVWHEMGHSMGLLHEHQRPNRDQWIVRYEFNYDVGLLSSPPFNHSVLDARRHDSVGGHDFDSVMHYGSSTGLAYVLPNLQTVRLPAYANRQELSVNTFSQTARGRIDTIQRWHSFGRLNGTGVKLDDAIAADVDEDGYDDLVLGLS